MAYLLQGLQYFSLVVQEDLTLVRGHIHIASAGKQAPTVKQVAANSLKNARQQQAHWCLDYEHRSPSAFSSQQSSIRHKSHADSVQPERPTNNQYGVILACLGGSKACSLTYSLSLSLSLFNTGAWDSTVSICSYLHMRCNQLFPLSHCARTTCC